MKRKIIRIGVFLTMVLMILSGCSVSNNAADSGESSDASNNKPTEQVMSVTDFENLLASQPLTVIKTKYVVQDDQYKSLYPDMLRAVLQNNTTDDIKNAVVAFAAWDSNNLPVKIKGQFDFLSGSYIKQVDFTDINLAGSDTYGEDSGYSLSENLGIATFKAIVVSFETFHGDTWENPYYDNFCSLYEGEKYSDDLSVKVKVVDSSFVSSANTAGNSDAKAETPSMTAEELENSLSTQPVTIIKTEYVVQDDQYKSLYPDMLRAVLQNNTTDDIKNAVVAFAAWDSNNLPVKIKGEFDFNSGSYIKQVDFTDINLVGSDTFGGDSGYSLSEDCNIATFKAIVVSYETFDGKTWDNPYYEDFCSLYEGQILN